MNYLTVPDGDDPKDESDPETAASSLDEAEDAETLGVAAAASEHTTVDDSAVAAADATLDDDDEQFIGTEFDFDESQLDGPSNMGTAPVSSARRGAVATAFLGAGLALEQIIYGVERSVPAVVQEASEPDPDADLVVHLDKDDPTKSWAKIRDGA